MAKGQTYTDDRGQLRDMSTGEVLPAAPAPVTSAPKASEGGVFSSQQGLKTLTSTVQTEQRLTPPVTQNLGLTTNGTTVASAGTSGAQGAIQPPKQSTNKITLINPQTGQTLEYGDADLNRSAIQSYLGSGWAVESSTGNTPSWLKPSSTGGTMVPAKSPEQEELERNRAAADADMGRLRNFANEMATDPALKSILDSIGAQWDSRIKQAEESGKSRVAAISTAMTRMGSRYAGGNAGSGATIVSAEERAVLDKISSLLADKSTALASARSAYEQQKWNQYVQLVNVSEKRFAESKEEIAKLNEVTRKEEEKRKELAQKAKDIEIRASRDQAITDLMAQGIKDPVQIMDMLNRNAAGEMIGDITFKEVNDITKELKEAEKAAPGVVGEWIAAKENDPTLSGITLQEYIKMKDPTLALDMEAKRLQIAKLEKDLIKEDQPDIDAANLLAYAQQYATTGTIPTGLPKGTFGMVSQVAKEMPKGTGTIVNRTTGIADSKTPATEQQDYSRLYNILKNTQRLKELDQKRIGGIVGGTLGKVFGSNDQAAYLAVRKAIVDDMQRMQSGAALTPDEMEFYSDYLPGRFSEPLGILGQDSMKKIENFENIMNNRLNERLSNNGLAIYGHTKVNIGGKQYTVGDVVEGAGGKTGRVLPDGTISVNE